MKNATVTGATGHLGNILVKQLEDKGVRVRVVVLPGTSKDALIGTKAEIVEADITKPAQLKQAFVGTDTVFHAAGLIDLGKDALHRLRAVNVEGTRNVLLAARNQGVKRIVYTSSIHAFVTPSGQNILDESASIDPDHTFSDYARTKAEATLLVRQAKTDLETVILYPVGITGPFDFQLSDLSRFILDFRTGKRHLLPKGGYYFIDVRDAAMLHIGAAYRAPPGGEYILSSQHQTTAQLAANLQDPEHKRRIFFVPPLVASWGEKLAQAFGRHGRFVLGDHALHELKQQYRVSSKRADRVLGKPKIPIATSLADSAAWLESQGFITPP